MPGIVEKLLAHWRLVLSVVAFLAILVLSIVLFKSCGHKAPKLNEPEIKAAQTAIATENRKQMIDILTNSDVREQAIDSNIKQAENAAAEAKQSYEGKSNQELADELNRRANQ
jgi:hypothetical protein